MQAYLITITPGAGNPNKTSCVRCLINAFTIYFNVGIGTPPGNPYMKRKLYLFGWFHNNLNILLEWIVGHTFELKFYAVVHCC